MPNRLQFAIFGYLALVMSSYFGWSAWNSYSRAVEMTDKGLKAAANLMQMGLAGYVALLALLVPVVFVCFYMAFRKSKA